MRQRRLLHRQVGAQVPGGQKRQSGRVGSGYNGPHFPVRVATGRARRCSLLGRLLAASRDYTRVLVEFGFERLQIPGRMLAALAEPRTCMPPCVTTQGRHKLALREHRHTPRAVHRAVSCDACVRPTRCPDLNAGKP